MTLDPEGLTRRLARRVAAEPAGRPLLVAASGGLDSTVLLHLLRFPGDGPARPLVAAHFDHAMRPDSEADAAWVAGLCRAWGVELHSARSDRTLVGEAAARAARYAFLHRVRETVGATWVLTAHHADDQAETVLFRALRGTGLRGLQGMSDRRSPGVWRPLLAERRDTLAAYARRVGLRHREDPTNRHGPARAVLRHRILPAAADITPDPVGALAGLARRARLDEGAWASLLPGLVRALEPRQEKGRIAVLRVPLLEHHPGVRARLLRHLARELGAPLTGAGTRIAMEFTSHGASGGGVDLGGGLTLERALDRLELRCTGGSEDGDSLWIPTVAAGRADVSVGGTRWQVRWGPDGIGADAVCFDTGALRMPLEVRAWRPGDRIRFDYGSKKLKKVFLECRVPVRERHRTPVVTDASGAVVWVPGLARSVLADPSGTDRDLHMEITRAQID